MNVFLQVLVFGTLERRDIKVNDAVRLSVVH